MIGEALDASIGVAEAGGHLVLSFSLHGGDGSGSSCQLTSAISSWGGRSALAFKSPQTVNTSRGRKYAHKANSSGGADIAGPGAMHSGPGRKALPHDSLSRCGPQHQRVFSKPGISRRSRCRLTSGDNERFSTVIQNRMSVSMRAMSRDK
jgi:hypothetical protein